MRASGEDCGAGLHRDVVHGDADEVLRDQFAGSRVFVGERTLHFRDGRLDHGEGRPLTLSF